MNRFRFNLMRGSVYAELRLRGYKINEGASGPDELEYLYTIARRSDVTRIAEIGFHLGFSSYAFLKAKKQNQVVSFDIRSHPFVTAAKDIIDRRFPDRHMIVYGDSKATIPEFATKNPNLKFDLVFIDGGHDYETAKNDILNARLVSHLDTLLIMDDLTPWLSWGKGPTRAWEEAIHEKQIVQLELYEDGKAVSAVNPPGKRAWALGKYILRESA